MCKCHPYNKATKRFESAKGKEFTLKSVTERDKFKITYLNDEFTLVQINFSNNDMTIRNERTGEVSVYYPNTPIVFI